MLGAEGAGGAFHAGPIAVSGSVLASWGVMAALSGAAWAATRRLGKEPRGLQVLAEGAVLAMEGAARDVLGEHAEMVAPFVSTLWAFVLAANLTGLIPGMSSPTADLSVTSSLAVLVFLSVHWFGIRAEGLRGYLRHYLSPNPLLLPFHVISELSRTLALAVRLFGNMMSLEMAALLAVLVAGLLVPIPILMLHIVEAVIQAYIFGMLALIYIAGGIQLQEMRRRKEGGSS